jgi:hypothetical protein
MFLLILQGLTLFNHTLRYYDRYLDEAEKILSKKPYTGK